MVTDFSCRAVLAFAGRNGPLMLSRAIVGLAQQRT